MNDDPFEATAEQVAAAQLKVVLDRKLGRPTPPELLSLASTTTVVDGRAAPSPPAEPPSDQDAPPFREPYREEFEDPLDWLAKSPPPVTGSLADPPLPPQPESAHHPAPWERGVPGEALRSGRKARRRDRD